MFRLKCLIFLAAGGLLLFLFVSDAWALTVSPPLIEAEAEPGEQLFQKIILFNETKEKLTIYPALENFAPKRSGGAPEYLGDKDPLGAARWIKVPVKRIEIAPGESKDILLTIQIPKAAEPGGHYAVLFWSDVPPVGGPPAGKGIAVSSRIPIIFLFSVKGSIQEKIEIISFQKSPARHWPVDFVLWMRNDGNVHLKPGGQLEIFNWRGQKKGEVVINPYGQAVLPQSIRRFDLTWTDSKPFWGRYHARAKIKYGQGRQELAASPIIFWLLPSVGQLVGIGFVILLILAGIGIAWNRLKLSSPRKRGSSQL